jgi:DNA mismatch endonuclease (patch repair protein)
MSLVRSKNTKPELVVRRLVHGLGLRPQLHVRHLPGSPDLVFKSLRKVIFVHGCFFHMHMGCSLARLPKTRLEFWLPKLTGNAERDQKNIRNLKSAGWKVLVVWECQLKDAKSVFKIIGFLEEPN